VVLPAVGRDFAFIFCLGSFRSAAGLQEPEIRQRLEDHPYDRDDFLYDLFDSGDGRGDKSNFEGYHSAAGGFRVRQRCVFLFASQK